MNMNIDLKEVCNGVVHPITEDTLTNYKKVIACPQLRKLWMKAMCKELGNIVQGYPDSNKKKKREPTPSGSLPSKKLRPSPRTAR